MIIQAKEAEAEVDRASVEYRPLHSQVRALERDARQFDKKINEWETGVSRLRGEENTAAREKLQERIAAATKSRDELLAQIPAEWADKKKTFSELTKNEAKIRTQFRRKADGIYQSVDTLSATLQGSEAYLALGQQLADLRGQIETGDPKEMQDVVNELSKQFGMEGASKVKSGLGKVRRALRKKTPDVEKALKEYDRAKKEYDNQIEWRTQAQGDFTSSIAAYQDALRGTVGMRQQPKMTREQGLFVASCQSGHRDISLNF